MTKKPVGHCVLRFSRMINTQIRVIRKRYLRTGSKTRGKEFYVDKKKKKRNLLQFTINIKLK